MPAVLVELGFLSNPDEEKKLQSAEYQGELVAALVRAIGRYKAAVEASEPAAVGAAPAAPGGAAAAPRPPARPQPARPEQPATTAGNGGR